MTAGEEPWTYAEFANEVVSSRTHASEDGKVSPRSVSNWCNSRSLPAEIEPILRALFGPFRGRGEAREALRSAFMAARAEVIKQAKPRPAGPAWAARDDHVAIDRSSRPTDRLAAADPVRQQIQSVICDFATKLVDPAKRLTNTRTWGDLSETAAAFATSVTGDPLAMPERLGVAYANLLRLGGFLETDIRVQRDPAAVDGPLDADIQGLLTALVRTAAPWLRGFPTVAAWDDAAGKALARPDLFQPVGEFVRIARAHEAISAQDATEMILLAKAADVTGYQGQKAGNRAVGGAMNLMLAAAEIFATFLSGAKASDYAKRSLLVQRVGAMLAAAEAEVTAFAETLPHDLRQALRALIHEGRQLGELTPASSDGDLQIPDDFEHLAREMILSGQTPPSAWLPFIRELDLSWGESVNLNLLSGLTALQSLDLSETEVGDLSPLSELGTLRVLSLAKADVTDLSTLSGLIFLKDLDLSEATVSDLSPLWDLASLEDLNLSETEVEDLSPLSGLTALQSLDLTDTPVRDLSPLSGLPNLRILTVIGTRVINWPLSAQTRVIKDVGV